MDRLAEFITAVDATKPLSHAAVTRLCRRARQGDFVARDQIWRSHLRLIAYTAKRFYRSQGFLEWGDLMQQGSVGLLRAIDRFDANKRSRGRCVSFSLYATYWIAHCIRRELHNRGRTIALPVYLQQELSRWKQELKGMRSVIRNRSAHEVKRLSSAETPVSSLDTNPSDASDRIERSSTLWPNVRDHFEQAMIQREVGQAIRHLVAALPSNEGYVVQKHFGLGDFAAPATEGLPLHAIAAEMGVSPQRIQQIKRRALTRLREAAQIRPELHPDHV